MSNDPRPQQPILRLTKQKYYNVMPNTQQQENWIPIRLEAAQILSSLYQILTHPCFQQAWQR